MSHTTNRFIRPGSWASLNSASNNQRLRPEYISVRDETRIRGDEFPGLNGELSVPTVSDQADQVISVLYNGGIISFLFLCSTVKSASPLKKENVLRKSNEKIPSLQDPQLSAPPRDVDRQDFVQAKRSAKTLRVKAAKAFERGDRANGERLSLDALSEETLAHSLQEASAYSIFHSKNASLGLDRIDLHGLYASEALIVLEERLRFVATQLDKVIPVFKVEVITGWGKGQTGRAILRPTIEQYLRNQIGLNFVERFPGHFFVSVRRNSFQD